MAKGKVAPFVATRGNELKVVVNVGIAVVSVQNINDAQQTMTSSVSIDLRWHDKALSWNTSDYDGVEMVEMPVDWVWTPHVSISNSLDKKNLLADVSTVVISHDGVAATFLDCEVETMCNLNRGTSLLIFIIAIWFPVWSFTWEFISSASPGPNRCHIAVSGTWKHRKQKLCRLTG